MVCTRIMTAAAMAIALIAMSSGQALAGPSAEALAPVKEKLDKKIKVQYLDAPLDKALDQLQRESGVTLIIDRQNLGVQATRPVTLVAESMSIKTTLDWITKMAGVDWDVRDGVILVSSQREILKTHLTLEIYDVRALTAQHPRFTGAPDLDLNSALSNTSSGGSSGGAAQASTTLFGEGDDVDVPSMDEIGEQIVNVVQESITPDLWDSVGGDAGVRIRFTQNGLLMVRHVPEEQARIRALLEMYQKASGKMVSFDARFLMVRTEALDKLMETTGGSNVLDTHQAAAFLKSVGPLNAGVRVLGASRTICMNAQRIHVANLRSKAFLSDIEPVSGALGLDPTLSVFHTGSVLDVEPVVTFDNSHIMLTLRCGVAGGTSEDHTPVPGGGVTGSSVTGGGSAAGDAKAGAGKAATVNLKTAEVAVVADAKLNLPEVDSVNFRTTVRVPDGGAVILTGVSSQFEHLKAENSEIVLFLRAKVVQPKRPAAKKDAAGNNGAAKDGAAKDGAANGAGDTAN